jgi:oligosaccharide repeat unit polymerase
MNKQKIKFELIVLICVSCVLLIIYDMITLGRIYLFYTLSVFLSAYFITTNVGKNVWSFRFIFKILIVALVFLMFFYKITVVRDIADGYNALLSILMYYSGALAYFNTIVLDIKQYEYGRMVMGGFESFLRSIDFVPVIRDYIPNLPISLEDQQIMFDVGFDVRYNAFGSLMMDAYKDAGIFGISILSMFIGIISSFLYRNIISCSKPLLLSFCTLSGVWIIWSPLCWSGGFYETGKIFVWLLVLDYISTKYKMKSLKTVFN